MLLIYTITSNQLERVWVCNNLQIPAQFCSLGATYFCKLKGFSKFLENIWRIFGNLQKVDGNLKKIVKTLLFVYIINKIIHGCL